MVWLAVGGLVVVLLIAVVLSRIVRRRRRGRTVTVAAAGTRLGDVIGTARARRALVRNATDLELCELWDRSGREIETVRLASSLEWDADLRRDILDELTARNPAAVESWLAERPDSDPGPYLRRTR